MKARGRHVHTHTRRLFALSHLHERSWDATVTSLNFLFLHKPAQRLFKRRNEHNLSFANFVDVLLLLCSSRQPGFKSQSLITSSKVRGLQKHPALLQISLRTHLWFSYSHVVTAAQLTYDGKLKNRLELDVYSYCDLSTTIGISL